MQMVAASKMRKAQQAAIDVGRSSRLLYRIQRKATTRAIDSRIRCSRRAPSGNARSILVAADKGLCGALNTNVFRLAAQFDPHSTVFITAGRKAAQFVAAHAAAARRRVPLRRHAAVRRSARHRGVRARPLPEGRSGRGPDRRHALRQHADAGAGVIEFLPVGAITAHRRCRDAEPKRRWPPTPPSSCSSRAPRPCSATCLAHYLNIFVYRRAAERQGQRAERPHGVDEERHRQRRSADQGSDARIQQAAPGPHHQGTAGDRRRPGRQ